MNQRAYFNIITPSNEEAELYIDVYWNEEVEDSEKVLVEWGVLWSNALTQPSFITREILIEKMNKIDFLCVLLGGTRPYSFILSS